MDGESAYALVRTREISGEFPYGFRFRYEDPSLENSIVKRGIVTPLFLAVRKEGGTTLVAGHRRFFCSQKMGLKQIPAVVLEERFTEKELFLLSLYSNWNQNFHELDRMRAIQKGEIEFGFTPEEIRDEIGPALGLRRDRGVTEEYRAAAALDSTLHQLVADRKLPFKGVGALRRFSRAEQKLLAERVFDRAHFSTNQLRLLAEWLFDLMKLRKGSLESLLEEEGLVQIMEHPKLEGRIRGEQCFDRVRALRFPRLTEAEKRFESLRRKLEGEPEVSVEAPPGFEEEGMTLRLRLRRRENLLRALRFLETHRLEIEAHL